MNLIISSLEKLQQQLNNDNDDFDMKILNSTHQFFTNSITFENQSVSFQQTSDFGSPTAQPKQSQNGTFENGAIGRPFIQIKKDQKGIANQTINKESEEQSVKKLTLKNFIKKDREILKQSIRNEIIEKIKNEIAFDKKKEFNFLRFYDLKTKNF